MPGATRQRRHVGCGDARGLIGYLAIMLKGSEFDESLHVAVVASLAPVGWLLMLAQHCHKFIAGYTVCGHVWSAVW